MGEFPGESAGEASSTTSEEHAAYGGISETIPFGVWICNPDGRLRYASDCFLELLDMSMEEATGFGWTKRIAEKNRGSVERWKQAIAEEREWDDEHQIVDRKGTTRTMIARGHPVRNESGQITSWIGVNLDITERKRNEQRVKDARIFAEGIVETVPSPLIVLDSSHRVIMANPAFYRHFKTEPKETEGRRLTELGDGQWDIPALRHLLDEVLAKNTSFNEYEVRHDFPNLGYRIILVNGRRLYQHGEQTEMILLAFQDVTESRAADERLQVMREAAAEQRERQRLAHRLHDHIQQLLVAGILKIDTVKDLIKGQNDDLEAILASAREVIQEAIRSSRNWATELTPPILAEAGLGAALAWISDQMHKDHGIQVEADVDDALVVEDWLLTTLLFDSVRELLLNVVKHARVNHAKLEAKQLWPAYLSLPPIRCHTSECCSQTTMRSSGKALQPCSTVNRIWRLSGRRAMVTKQLN